VIAKGWRGYKRGTTQIEGFDRDGTVSASPRIVEVNLSSGMPVYVVLEEKECVSFRTSGEPPARLRGSQYDYRELQRHM